MTHLIPAELKILIVVDEAAVARRTAHALAPAGDIPALTFDGEEACEAPKFPGLTSSCPIGTCPGSTGWSGALGAKPAHPPRAAWS
jgi:hypothetical protein